MRIARDRQVAVAAQGLDVEAEAREPEVAVHDGVAAHLAVVHADHGAELQLLESELGAGDRDRRARPVPVRRERESRALDLREVRRVEGDRAVLRDQLQRACELLDCGRAREGVHVGDRRAVGSTEALVLLDGERDDPALLIVRVEAGTREGETGEVDHAVLVVARAVGRRQPDEVGVDRLGAEIEAAVVHLEIEPTRGDLGAADREGVVGDDLEAGGARRDLRRHVASLERLRTGRHVAGDGDAPAADRVGGAGAEGAVREQQEVPVDGHRVPVAAQRPERGRRVAHLAFAADCEQVAEDADQGSTAGRIELDRAGVAATGRGEVAARRSAAAARSVDRAERQRGTGHLHAAAVPADRARSAGSAGRLDARDLDRAVAIDFDHGEHGLAFDGSRPHA